MAFEIEAGKSVGKQIPKLARKRLAEALAELEKGPRSPHAQDAAVHTARKRVREVRAVLRLVRSEIGEQRFARDNTTLRDVGRPLSEVRDATALVSAVGALRSHHRGRVRPDVFEPLERTLRERRAEIRRRVVEGDKVFARVAEALRGVEHDIDSWGLPHKRWGALCVGLHDSYKRGRSAMAVAFNVATDENYHEWRKRSKDVRYQLELLRPLWPAIMEPTAEQAKALADQLGDDHDLAVLQQLLAGECRARVPANTLVTLGALIVHRRNELQSDAKVLGSKLYAESPGAFLQRLQRYWDVADGLCRQAGP